MKNGTLYAKRIKKLFTRLKSLYGKPDLPEPTDPIQQLIIGLLAADVPESKAVRAARLLQETMVDVNDLRVSTPAEVAAVIGQQIPNSTARAAAIRDALNAVFRRENAVSLAHLPKAGRREAKQYLEQLDGVDSFAVASVLLWSLGGHAIPVDRRMYEVLRKEDLVEPSASIAEVQAFLERNVAAADARLFCLLMQKYVSSKAPRGSAHKAASARSQKPKGSARAPLRNKKSGSAARGRTTKTARRAANR